MHVVTQSIMSVILARRSLLATKYATSLGKHTLAYTITDLASKVQITLDSSMGPYSIKLDLTCRPDETVTAVVLRPCPCSLNGRQYAVSRKESQIPATRRSHSQFKHMCPVPHAHVKKRSRHSSSINKVEKTKTVLSSISTSQRTLVWVSSFSSSSSSHKPN